MPLKIFMILIVVSIFISGCVSKESIQLVRNYAESSTAVHKSVFEAYDASITARHNAKLMTAVRDGSTIKDLEPEKIDNSGQRAALSNLLVFSESISHLASDDIGEDLDKQTEKLNSSLNSLSENPRLTESAKTDSTLISTGINTIGRAYNEYYRFKALKKVLKDSNATIVETINLLRKDLPAWKMNTKISLQKDLKIRMYFLNNPNRCIDNPSTTCVKFTHTIEERKEAYITASDLKVQINQLNALFRGLDKALESIARLHSAIIISLDSDNDADIAAAKKAIASTRTQLNAIKAFQKSIKE